MMYECIDDGIVRIWKDTHAHKQQQLIAAWVAIPNMASTYTHRLSLTHSQSSPALVSLANRHASHHTSLSANRHMKRTAKLIVEWQQERGRLVCVCVCVCMCMCVCVCNVYVYVCLCECVLCLSLGHSLFLTSLSLSLSLSMHFFCLFCVFVCMCVYVCMYVCVCVCVYVCVCVFSLHVGTPET